jgi:hypothetical protein
LASRHRAPCRSGRRSRWVSNLVPQT